MEAIDYVVGHYAAPNDRNGNPRRCFVLFRTPRYGADIAPVAVANEGHGGDAKETVRALFAAKLTATDRVRYLPKVNVAATEYRRLLKNGGPS